jgi:sugar/nucleoside kinase (ribokinase family)
MATDFDVCAIGNALVDVLCHESHEFIAELGLAPGSMTLVDAAESERVYSRMGPTAEVSGGSAANTVAGVAAFGGRAAYISRIADDTFGHLYAHDLRSTGVHFEVKPAEGELPTGRCLVLVTPDAQRTMCTYLGASSHLDVADIDFGVVERAAVLYLEGYLWDQPAAMDAFREAAAAAHRAGRRVALTLSDSFCVERHREAFLDLIERNIDILFANEAEITALYEVPAFDDALQHVRGHCEIAVLTRSERGALIVAGSEVHVIDAERVGAVVDTTGAGDLYAAGFLFGLTQGYGLANAGRLGALAAAEVISHIGARPEADLRALAAAMIVD